MDNTGSFGAAIGGGQGILQAMQRRGMDASTAQQQSPTSAGGGVPMPTDMEAASAALPGAAPAAPTAPPDSDTTIAMKALATVVTNDSKMKRDLATMQGGM